ncbi:MAG: lysophospholipase [Candidatus Izimaplasma sp.]|nr:lysophospholipase [Candidatus Izimaplasma bacterium]
MTWEFYLIFSIVILILLYLYVAMQIAIIVVLPKVKGINQTIEEESLRDSSLVIYLENNKTSEYDIISRYGYKIRVYELFNVKTDKYVVISHGYTYSHLGSIKYAKMMTKLGYNVILYDHRYHGNSGGKNTTLGYYEKNDLYDLISHIYKEKGKDIYLGTYGESMGSATVLLEQAIDERVKFVISDSGFKDLAVLVKRKIIDKKLPSWLFFPAVNLFAWAITKAKITKVKPINAIKNTKIPILFVHGKNDDFISYGDSIEMYETYHGEKMIYIGEELASHARTYYYDKEKYFEVLKEFNDRYLL